VLNKKSNQNSPSPEHSSIRDQQLLDIERMVLDHHQGIDNPYKKHSERRYGQTHVEPKISNCLPEHPVRIKFISSLVSNYYIQLTVVVANREAHIAASAMPPAAFRRSTIIPSSSFLAQIPCGDKDANDDMKPRRRVKPQPQQQTKSTAKPKE